MPKMICYPEEFYFLFLEVFQMFFSDYYFVSLFDTTKCEIPLLFLQIHDTKYVYFFNA